MSRYLYIKADVFKYLEPDCLETIARMKKEFLDFKHLEDESLTMRMALGCKGLPAENFVNLLSAVIGDGTPEVVYRIACEFVADSVYCVKHGAYE